MRRDESRYRFCGTASVRPDKCSRPEENWHVREETRVVLHEVVVAQGRRSSFSPLIVLYFCGLPERKDFSRAKDGLSV